MSSNCSISCCSSPDMPKSGMDGITPLSDFPSSRMRTTVPEVKKDNKYWERRRRNNEAARRSREKRRQNDMVMDKRIIELTERNKDLEQEIFQLKLRFGLTNASDGNQNQLPANFIESTTQFNSSVVFPIVTALPSQTNSSSSVKINIPRNGITTIPNTDDLSNSIKQNTSSNTIQSNILTLSNIPLLSNLISNAPINDEIASKATLLLPSVVPKIPIITSDSLPVPNLFKLNLSDQSVIKKSSTDCSEPCNRKLDLHDILDLSIRQDIDDDADVSDTGMKDMNNINDLDTNSVDDSSLRNSFLSGIVQFDSKNVNRSSSCKKRKSSTICCSRNTACERKKTMCRHSVGLSLQTRLEIRKEVSTIIRRQNGKIFDAIKSLSNEIAELKSALLLSNIKTEPKVNHDYKLCE